LERRPSRKDGAATGHHHMAVLKRILDTATNLTAVIACLCILFMMGHVTLDVVMRAFFNRPLTGTFTFVAHYYMVFLVCLPLAFVERFDGHISVEVLTNRFSDRVRHHLFGWTFPVTATIFAVIAYATWLEASAKFSIRTFMIENNMAIPIWFGYFALPVGYGLLSLYLVLKFVGYLAGNPVLPERLEGDDDMLAGHD
jgi:TRAP-type C4-dicarboxylate transport system permease small subunit